MNSLKKSMIIIMIISIFLKCTYIQANEVDLNRWEDKRWITIGDSITAPNKYQNIVNSRLKFSKVLNKGRSGQTMAFNTKDNYSSYEAKKINFKEYDLVSIFIGTNDFRYNKKLGTIKESDFDVKTFLGSYQMLIEYILVENPKIEIVLITPTQRDNNGYDINTINKSGCRLKDYVNGIKDLGVRYSLSVLDLYSNSGINPRTLDVYTTDGLHLNNYGYEIISRRIVGFLMSI